MIQNKVKSKLIFTEKRFNAGYFLNEDALNSFKLEINPKNCIELSELANVFNPPIFKRQFCQPSERAINYCQSSDVTNALEGSDVYINKKQAEKVGSVVKKNQILVTGFGTIGNTRLVNELSEGISYANNVCRIESNGKLPHGYLYGFMTSKFGRSQLNKNASGSVVRYIEAPGIKRTLIPILPKEKQQQIHQLIVDSANLRVEANKLLKEVKEDLLSQLGFNPLTNEEYEYFGNHVQGRNVSSFKVSSKEISSVSINAFNYSRRIKKLVDKIKSVPYKTLSDCLIEGGYFSTGSFKRLEINSDNGIKLINQSDIFNSRKIGKNLSRRAVGNVKLVEYGEVLIAGVGTLGEGETFCRTIFSNEELENQLVSGEFIRLKTNDEIPSGYLFAWLNTDYGLRLIRSTQSGTKLCRPIPELLKNIPVPILSKEKMLEIDSNVKKAHNDLFLALNKENQAINLIENEIDAWQ